MSAPKVIPLRPREVVTDDMLDRAMTAFNAAVFRDRAAARAALRVAIEAALHDPTGAAAIPQDGPRCTCYGGWRPKKGISTEWLRHKAQQHRRRVGETQARLDEGSCPVHGWGSE